MAEKPVARQRPLLAGGFLGRAGIFDWWHRHPAADELLHVRRSRSYFQDCGIGGQEGIVGSILGRCRGTAQAGTRETMGSGGEVLQSDAARDGADEPV